MNFGLSEEQDLLRQEVRKFLDEQCPIEEVRKLMKEERGYSSECWSALAELGWTGLIVDEKFGGAGLGWIDLIVLLEETGRSLFPSPLISTILIGSLIEDLGSDDQKKAKLPGIAAGTTIGALALLDDPAFISPDSIRCQGKATGDGYSVTGKKLRVADATSAGLLALAFRDGRGDILVALVDTAAKGIEIEALRTVDESKRIANVSLEDVEIPRDAILGSASHAWPAIERLMDRGAVAVTAEILGAGEAALALTVQYAKDRVQFGSPIGRYQGVKHPLAEMYVDLESTKSLLYYTGWALEASPDEVAYSASKAKAFGTETFMRIGVDGVQLHGAVGYTEEYDIQLFLKRSKWARPAFGDEEYHLERTANLGGL
jgi:alkylation response protein AidB-like acyl-CoA dehydrogenase